jgi:hypothetical protein
MAKYRAIVSIEFDGEDLKELASSLGCTREISPDEGLQGELDNLTFGTAWIEQIYQDGEPLIRRLTTGTMVEVSDFED